MDPDESLTKEQLLAELATLRRKMDQDLAARRLAEQVLRHRNAYLAALQETTLELVSRLDLQSLLESIVERAGHLLGTPHGLLDLVEPETGQLKPKVGLAMLRQSLDFEVKPNEGLAGKVWQRREPMVVDDYDAWPGRIEGFGYGQIRAIVGVPLLSGEHVIGVLALAYDAQTQGVFDQEAVDLLTQFARLAALAIENARLFAQTQRDALAKAELLREVNHRVKNNLVAIIGLLQIEQDHAPAEGREVVREALGRAIARIEGLLAAHELLSASQWSPMRVDELAHRIIETACGALPRDQRVSATVRSSDVEVSPRQASNLALVMNELVTNSIKHAAAGRAEIKIGVEVTLEDGEICLEYRDDGPGYPHEVLRMGRPSVGMYLLRNLVTGSLRGTLRLSNEGGALTRIRIKAEERSRT
jgi:two-component sensor histidine kinase